MKKRSLEPGPDPTRGDHHRKNYHKVGW